MDFSSLTNKAFRALEHSTGTLRAPALLVDVGSVILLEPVSVFFADQDDFVIGRPELGKRIVEGVTVNLPGQRDKTLGGYHTLACTLWTTLTRKVGHRSLFKWPVLWANDRDLVCVAVPVRRQTVIVLS